MKYIGKKEENIKYTKRPGAYAIIVNNTDNKIGIVTTGKDNFYLGGGIENGETELEALKRELIEESGYLIKNIRKFDEVGSFIDAEDKGYIEVIANVYIAEFDKKITEKIEKDHTVLWIDPEEYVGKMCREWQEYILKKYIEENSNNKKEVIDFLGNKFQTECLGCSIGKHKIMPIGGFVYESESFVIHQDPEVPIEGFLIISAKKHIKSITDLTKKERNEIIELVNASIQALKETKITNEVTIIQEERSNHLHIWIFPNYEWMNVKFGKGINYLRAINDYAKENINSEKIEDIMNKIQKLKAYFQNYNNK